MTIEEIQENLLEAQTLAEPALAEVKEFLDRLSLLGVAAKKSVILPSQKNENPPVPEGLEALIRSLLNLQTDLNGITKSTE